MKTLDSITPRQNIKSDLNKARPRIHNNNSCAAEEHDFKSNVTAHNCKLFFNKNRDKKN